jgi:hypothetical protein
MIVTNDSIPIGGLKEISYSMKIIGYLLIVNLERYGKKPQNGFHILAILRRMSKMVRRHKFLHI